MYAVNLNLSELKLGLEERNLTKSRLELNIFFI